MIGERTSQKQGTGGENKVLQAGLLFLRLEE